MWNTRRQEETTHTAPHRASRAYYQHLVLRNWNDRTPLADILTVDAKPNSRSGGDHWMIVRWSGSEHRI